MTRRLDATVSWTPQMDAAVLTSDDDLAVARKLGIKLGSVRHRRWLLRRVAAVMEDGTATVRRMWKHSHPATIGAELGVPKEAIYLVAKRLRLPPNHNRYDRVAGGVAAKTAAQNTPPAPKGFLPEHVAWARANRHRDPEAAYLARWADDGAIIRRAA